MILFCLIWVVTFGRHYFWLLPHLTEDVGFFESFVPLYQHDLNIKTPDTQEEDNKNKDNEENIENEENLEKVEPEETPTQLIEDEEVKNKDLTGSEKDQDSGSDASNGNGYEMVEQEDLEGMDEEEEEQDSEGGVCETDTKTSS